MPAGRPKGGAKHGGRKKGTSNKQSVAARTAMREAIHLAVEQAGSDGKGKDGLVGYLKMIALTDIKAMATLIGRTIPTVVEGDTDAPHKIIIEYINVPSPKRTKAKN